MTSILVGLLIGLCLVGTGFISILKQAFMRFNTADIVLIQNKYPGRSIAFSRLFQKQDAVMSSLILGQALFAASTLVIMTYCIFNRFTPLSVACYIIVSASFMGLATQILPKLYIQKQSHEFLAALLPLLQAAYLLFSVPARLLNMSAMIAANRFPQAFSKQACLFNATDYRLLIQRHEDGILAPNSEGRQRKLIQQGIAALGLMTVAQLLIPLKKLEIIDVATPHEALLAFVFSSKAQRILMYSDKPDNIVGVLHTPLLMRAFCLADGDKEAIDITSAVSEPYFIHGEKPLLEQMQDFLGKQEQFSLVQNSDGVLIGAITLEKIFETLSLPLQKP